MLKGQYNLTYAQKCQIYILKDRGDSKSSIARALDAHPSAIGRELRRNASGKGYRHGQAHEKALLRRKF